MTVQNQLSPFIGDNDNDTTLVTEGMETSAPYGFQISPLLYGWTMEQVEERERRDWRAGLDPLQFLRDLEPTEHKN